MLPQNQGLYSLSGKTSYLKISWSPEVARFGFRLFWIFFNNMIIITSTLAASRLREIHCLVKRGPGSAFIKPDQLDPWIKDQIKITPLPTISHLQLLNFVSCGRACPSHMTQNLVTVGAKLFPSWSLIHGLRWSGLIKAEPGQVSFWTIEF